jgi:hypothetical protein
MSDYRDTGWGPALRRWPMFLLPAPILTFRVIQRRGGWFDSLTALRILWLHFVTALVLLLTLVIFIEPTIGIPNDWYLWALLLVQLWALAGVLWARSRSLDASSEGALAGAYRAQFLVGAAFARSVGLFGFLGVFLLEELWPYLEALPLALLGLALVAPTRGDIDRRQRQITAQGSPLSLGRALLSTPRGR